MHIFFLPGQGQYGERDILLQAEDYAACAAAYPLNFVCPTVVFAFYNGVTTQMAEYLQKKRVTVLGQVVNVSLDVEHKVASLAQENENCHGSEKNDMEACAGAVTVSEDVLKMPKTITVRPNDPDETERVIDVCPQSEVNVPEVDIYGTQANGIERSTSAASLRCDRGQFQANIDKESQPHIIDRTQVHEENDSNSFDNVDGIISVKSNKSSLQVASHQYVNTIHQEYDDIALHHEEITTSKSRAGVSNVNSPLSLQHRHSNQEKLTSNNSAKSIKPNYSGSILFEGISFIPETRIVEKFAESTLDENSLTCTPLTEFISSELMSLDMVDYSRLDEILADNDIQTIDNIGKINLDVSSLITLVSAVAHGRCNFRFQEQILSDQAAEERRDPVMPKLLKFMEGNFFAVL